MQKKLVSKSGFDGWLKNLGGQYRVYGPVKVEDQVFFGPADGKPLELDFRNTKNAPKNALFRHTETLMRFTRTAKGMEFTADGDAAEKAVVVVRPCDANSLVFLDKVFGQQPYDDPYYLSRRENTAIVALACVKAPYATCFCTSVGGEPVGDRGADVLATDLGDKYLVEFLTPRGEALLPLLEGASDAGEAELGKKEEIREAAKATIQSIVPQKEATAKLKPNFESPYWAELHRRCLACGTCTYLCPSCHCFDITDETKGDEGVRIRSWDSCMFPLFTRETSGHNPRPGQRERWRQRVMHKFSYIPENFNEVGCVGCGRCVINCPVNLDIRKIVEDISKL